MGSEPDEHGHREHEGPAHPIQVSRRIYLSVFPVTQGEYQAIMGKNPSKHPKGGEFQPVENVSWTDAELFCTRLSHRAEESGHHRTYRLPTEAEWEYACRAGSTNLFSFGADPALGDTHAWTGENSDAMTHPVGLKLPNAWGLYDMHGNVWEWCLDWFEPYPAMPLTDPVGPASSKYKLFKGGGWNQDLEYARAVNRFMMSPSNGIHFVGFRVALGPVPPPPAQPNPPPQ
jgi:formylglycine-generating enzyme required for sulfatase activity